MGHRELIYTQFSTAIDNFIKHKITKIDLYNIFTELVEISTEEERKDRSIYNSFWDKHKDLSVSLKKIPYSNWHDGLTKLH